MREVRSAERLGRFPDGKWNNARKKEGKRGGGRQQQQEQTKEGRGDESQPAEDRGRAEGTKAKQRRRTVRERERYRD